jgi:hypothetical protein
MGGSGSPNVNRPWEQQRLRRGWSRSRGAEELDKLHDRLRDGPQAAALGVSVDDAAGASLAEGLASEVGMDRRAFLRHIATTATAITTEPHLDTYERLSASLRGPGSIDSTTVTRIEHIIQESRHLDDLLGSAEMIGPVRAHLRIAVRLVQRPGPDDLRRRLLTAVGELTQLAGFMAFDMSDHAAAKRYLQLTLAASNEALSPALAGCALGWMGVVSLFGQDRRESLELAQAGLLRIRTVSSIERSWLHAIEARAHAKAGDPTSAQRSMEQAKIMLDRGSGDEPPRWLYYWNTGQLASYEGACFIKLRKPEAARQALQTGLDLLDPSVVRERARYLTHLATTYLQQGEVAKACDLATEALRIALETDSPRVVTYIRELRATMRPWRRDPVVRMLDEQLRSSSLHR